MCRLCRREGEKLYLKGLRCESQKCPMISKNYPPGQHGQNVKRAKSEFLRQLREKQKAKRIFGLNERQFQNYYKKAVKVLGVTGHEFLKLLEKRLDNVMYRAGFASSRSQARQIVNHGLCFVNAKKVRAPNHMVKVNDKFEIKDKAKKFLLFEDVKNKKNMAPKWLKADLATLSGEVIAEPGKDDFEKSIQINLVIEYYSK